ncbi:MAG: hypothetical protein IT276_09360 [Ignavibacteriaceae bacterium]|nr:hypothetical protein [Ignavibacterium sp.]MCC6255111.1 hypothetical protein [Ignavibacteriaceae bacterium]HMN25207.1 hypothetical protein [Ignavibacteriaceae bacterium]HRN27913.1 hypothetical protein [Ignavibacteriaceae bacterium]HRP91294.1 hypothetical protein [Ignavibacteriaceae bacterium]
MKKSFLLFAFLFSLVLGISQSIFAQNEPVLYFCEKYGKNGEVGVSDRFTTGYLTVMVKCDYALELEDCSIQFDLYNPRTKKFEYYKKFDYVVEPDMKYIFFAKNDESDMKFEDPGFYRVFLLNDKDKTVASALIEIID